MFNIFRKSLATGRVTTPYPTRPDQPPAAFRGAPRLVQERCRNCGACQQVCPSGALTAEQLDLGLCHFCGRCAETCSSGALTMSQEFELAARQRSLLLRQVPAAAAIDEIGAELEQTIKRLLGRSLHIRHVDSGSCNGCDWEMVALTGPVYDLQRFGLDFVASPRHADCLMVTGCPSLHLVQALEKTYEAAPHPKLVVAVGTCAISGGLFRDSYATLGGTDQILPVDLYIPGCPPRPQALLYGFLKLLKRIEKDR